MDEIRRIAVKDIVVVAVKKSNELETLYKDALIVVAKGTGQGQTYTVTRYWKNRFTNWVESEHLFDLLDGPYDDLFVFDSHAIALKDSKVIKTVWFDQYRGKAVPLFMVTDLFDEYKNTDFTI